MDLEACKRELAEQAADMEAAADYASSLALKGQSIASQMGARSSQLQTAKGPLQRDLDGYQRDNAALRASLGACQRQSEKFRTELVLAHRSQQGMLTTLEAARQEGNGLRSQLAAQLQGLPALRAMRGQLKAQQHALLGLQEQLQAPAYPALEAATSAGTFAITGDGPDQQLWKEKHPGQVPGASMEQELGSASSSQASSAASSSQTRRDLHPLAQDRRVPKMSSRGPQPVIPLQTQHQAALNKIEKCRLLLRDQKRSSTS
ncbi:hypothetical protein WJX84_002639 [Apatococcus fuscideae]|uniref:Uncharacterized protein n=1 Tax=Apatococcus fuscideae TaxID=2026836 RepID=A0AAW1T0X4_9CHLO